MKRENCLRIKDKDWMGTGRQEKKGPETMMKRQGKSNKLDYVIIFDINLPMSDFSTITRNYKL